MKIWGRANSINVMKVLWAADECGLKYERTDVGGAFGGNDQKWYLDMNPNGVVPTIDDGGRVIWESNSAVRYLSAKYAAGTLWPNDPGSAKRGRPLDGLAAQHDLREHARRVLGAGAHAAGEARHGGHQEGRRWTPASCSAGSTRILPIAATSPGQHFTMGDIPVGCFVHRWYALDIAAPGAQEPPGLVRSAGDAPGLRQAHHGQADVTCLLPFRQLARSRPGSPGRSP